jgi:predicted amidohydrolase YtcJ
MRWVAGALVAALSAASCHHTSRPAAQDPADLILRNGRIVTLDDTTPEVRALAARGGRIAALGTDREISKLIGPATRVIDLKGALAIPAFIEGHGHFMGIGEAKLQLDLMQARNWDEIVSMVAEAVRRARPGQLIRGRGWHQEKWDKVPPGAIEGIPHHSSLSAVSPDNPVILRHASGHASFANARAMEMASIDRHTPDPPGGTILRDANGDPTGYFRETAGGLLAKAAAAATPLDPRRVARAAIDEVLANGIASFQDAGSSFDDIELFKRLADEGSLGVRLWVMIREPNARLRGRLAAARTIGHAGGRLTVRAIKHSIDGALGSHGAWLLEPYEDLPESTGLNTTPVDTIEETARLAIAEGYQLCVHAIGDRGNRETLDLFERTFQTNPDKKDLRWRVEHAQHLHPDDIPRFAKLGVIASMQGVHCTSDGPWVPTRLGPKRSEEGAYVWRSLLEAGAVVSNGTDAPVEHVSPIASFYATVSRMMGNGKRFFPRERLSRIDALKTYTIHCAYAAFEEDVKGTLSPGKYADITVLSKDILSIPEEQIPSAKVLYTIVGGDVLYSRP